MEKIKKEWKKNKDVHQILTTVSKKKSYPHNRPWRPIGLWDVKDPTLSKQSAHS
jgi:translation initiation factor 2 alpha subunit (eIF-2alpha)